MFFFAKNQVRTLPVCTLYLIKYDTSKGKAIASISNHFTIVKQGITVGEGSVQLTSPLR
jgi:hypothetical protein